MSKIQENKSKFPKKSFWNNNHKYFKKYDDLYTKLVPHIGKCSTMMGELLRCWSSIYYDVYNNGGCNIDNMKYKTFFVKQYADEINKKMKKDNDIIVLLNLIENANIYDDGIKQTFEKYGIKISMMDDVMVAILKLIEETEIADA